MTAAPGSLTPAERPPVQKAPWTHQRTLGVVLLCIWAALALAVAAFMVESWNPTLFERYAPRYMSGLWITIQLVVLSVIFGALLSIPIAYGRMSENRFLSALAYAYVYFFRGTPLLAQTFLIYYGLGSFRPELQAIGLWSFFRDAWNCALFAFTLNTAAYQAEILRGAIGSVGRGQWEAASALGIPKLLAIRKIIIPQAMIVALRPYGNEVILMIKGSAIVAIITVFDLMGETRRAYSQTFDFQTYIWAALIYLALVELLRNLIDLIEKRITRHLKR
ncbi:ABC transporter permease [Nitratireductor indicus]|uniref:Polar amino acid ABC transporter inner membrane subunit n=1 Tax=Nitratireductor indicus C115 TaxID=1231190 RepID=K2PRY5_9HYPH|nr:ABC transporter permease [Nitratireductor indicus]EKF43837.1 polar amino acid ABC transporter inner membrane subunit [Nitratireductor indicus C115]MDS1135427.1 ABC transporter permease [Nitratireductor indicus]SFQ15872.1 polar amino acid transport system permease protein [Nitratireductor indicus]